MLASRAGCMLQEHDEAFAPLVDLLSLQRMAPMAYQDALFQLGMKMSQSGSNDVNDVEYDLVDFLRTRGDALSLEAAEEIRRLRLALMIPERKRVTRLGRRAAR